MESSSASFSLSFSFFSLSFSSRESRAEIGGDRRRGPARGGEGRFSFETASALNFSITDYCARIPIKMLIAWD
jgi:hypothetical protein